MWLVANNIKRVKQIIDSIIGVEPSKLLLVWDLDHTLIGDLHVTQTHNEPVIRASLCDVDAPNVLAGIHQAGISCIVVTARQRSSAGITEETLRVLLKSPVLLKHSAHETPKWYFANGICYCGSENKGTVLANLLELFPNKYDCIVVVDDLASNLTNYSERLSRTNNRYVPILYKFIISTPSPDLLRTLKVQLTRRLKIHTCENSSIEINEHL